MPHAVPDGSPARLIPGWEDAHPWLVSAIVVLSLGSRNVKWVTLADVLVVLGLVWLGVTALFLALLLVRRSARQAALMTSCLCLFGFYYGVAFDALEHLPLAGSLALRHGLLAVMAVGLTGIAAWYRGELKPFAKFVSLASGIAASVFGLNFGRALWDEPRTGWADVIATIPPRTEVAAQDASHPDIYYIILDGYARGDVLTKYYGFDNAPFLDGLRDRGFYVADRSCTNYPGTAFSLPSSLNMLYHSPLDRRGGLKPLAEMVRTNEAGLRLKQRGYKLVHFNTRFIATAVSDIADVSLGEQTFLPPGSRMMLLHIIDHGLSRFINGGERAIWAAQHRRALAELSDVPRLPGPKFTFLHLIAPHPPLVFTREGRTDWNLDQNDRASYTGQLEYLNHEITKAVDSILANSSTPPVIIIQSDHGAGFCRDKRESGEPVADQYVQERVPILNAYLVPAAMRDKLYPTISPVNSFRLLLTECFGFDYPLLPDRHFMFHRGAWATLAEITDRVHDGVPDPSLTKPRLDAAPGPLATADRSTRVE